MTDLLDNMLSQWSQDIETTPFPPPPFRYTPPVIDRTCDCGAAAVAMVYRWRPDGLSVFEPKCRDHKGGA